MYLKYVQIVNYKNLRKTRFEFGKGVNTVIGENDSGKSNAMTAMRILLDDNYFYNTKRLKESDFSKCIGDWRGHWIIISSFFDQITDEDKQSEVCAQISPEVENENFLKSFIRCEGNNYGVITLFIRPNKKQRKDLFKAQTKNDFNHVRSNISLLDYEFFYTVRSQADFTDDKVYKEIVGDFEIYNGLISPYRISLKNKNKAAEYLKLAKALMTLEKDTNKYLKFQTIISEKDGLEFKYNDNDIILKDIPDFLLVNYVKLYEETMVYIDENMAKELKFKRLTEEKLKKEEKLNDLQNYITTFLDSKKTFFGKFRYFLGKDPLKQLEQKEKELENKKKKEVISEKNNISLDNDEEKKLREIERKEIQELKEKLNLKRDFCTIEEYIYLYKEYEKQNKKLKSYLKDIRSSRTYNRKFR